MGDYADAKSDVVAGIMRRARRRMTVICEVHHNGVAADVPSEGQSGSVSPPSRSLVALIDDTQLMIWLEILKPTKSWPISIC